jgi:hypothetical protein
VNAAGTGTGSGPLLSRPRPARSLPQRAGRIAGRLALAVLVAAGLLLQPNPGTAVFFLPYVIVGAILVARRPRNPIGWILVVIAYGFVGTTTPSNLDVAALQAGTAPIDQALPAWVVGWSGHVGYACFFALAVLFPAGRLPDGRGRVASVAGIGVGATTAVIAAVSPDLELVVGGAASISVPNPIVRLPLFEPLSALPIEVLILVPVGVCLIGIGSMLVRYRRSTGIARLQFRWLGAALAFAVASLAGGLGGLALFGEGIGDVVWYPAMLAYPSVPVAVGIAVLRYRLYDIDRVISRSVAYALVTGTLVVVFVAGNLLVQSLLADFTQANTIAVAASTLLVFVLAQPLRRRIQWLVDLRFDRSRIDAEQTVRGFADRQRDQVDVTALLDDLRRTAVVSVRPESMAVWLRGQGRS